MDAQKREGYGRIPNCLVKSGAWAKFHWKMKAVYVALVGLLVRTMTYTSDGTSWRASYGYPTNEQLARAAGVRVADISKVVDRLEEIGLVIKRPATINQKPRNMYIILPPGHPMYSRIGYSCDRIYSQLGKGWGLTRPWGHKKPHELPVRLQPHESPTRLHSTDTHRPKNPPPLPQTVRRPSFPRAAARFSHKSTTKGKVSDRLLPPLFTALPREEWDEHTAHLITNGHRLRDIEQAKSIAAGVAPDLPPFDEGKGGKRGKP